MSKAHAISGKLLAHPNSTLVRYLERRVPDAPCDSQTWNADSNDNNKDKNARRCLHDDDVLAVDFDKLTMRFDGPRFVGKTPVKDIANLLQASNLSTPMTKI